MARCSCRRAQYIAPHVNARCDRNHKNYSEAQSFANTVMGFYRLHSALLALAHLDAVQLGGVHFIALRATSLLDVCPTLALKIHLDYLSPSL